MNFFELAKKLNGDLRRSVAAGTAGSVDEELAFAGTPEELWMTRGGADVALVRLAENGAWVVEANAVVAVDAEEASGQDDAQKKRAAGVAMESQVWPRLAALGFTLSPDGDLWDPQEDFLLRWGLREAHSYESLVETLRQVAGSDFNETVELTT
jgi:hypothetical protein